MSLGASCQSQSSENWTKEKAAKWFNGNEWLNGLKLKAHQSTDQLEFARQYHKNKALWDKAFAFLKNTNLDTISVGKHVIDGDNLYASVTEAPTKDFDKTKWESHKKYADIQYIIKGKEKMGVAPLSATSVVTPYDETKDVAFYNSNDGKFYEAQPGTFFIFFPQDAHRPSTKIEGCESDKKIVLKVKLN
jgi:YhcH/YjgK/YiaL family protein